MKSGRMAVVIAIALLLALVLAVLFSARRHPTDIFPLPDNVARGA